MVCVKHHLVWRCIVLHAMEYGLLLSIHQSVFSQPFTVYTNHTAILRQLELCTVKGSTIATTTHAPTPVVDVHAETPPTTVAWDGPDMTAIPLDGDYDAQCGADDSACPVCLDAPADGVDWRRFGCGHGVCFPCLKQVCVEEVSFMTSCRLENAPPQQQHTTQQHYRCRCACLVHSRLCVQYAEHP